MKYYNSEGRADYNPPILSNGSLCISVDCEGTQKFDRQKFENSHKGVSYYSWNNMIWWEGRRYSDSFIRPLISFGKTYQETYCNSKQINLLNWEQNLDVDGGFMRSVCTYENGAELITTAFIADNCNMLVINKKLVSQGSVDIKFTYKLEQADKSLPANVTLSKPSVPGIIDYTAYGQHTYKGIISLFSDKESSSITIDNTMSVSFHINSGEDITVFLLFNDNIDEKNYMLPDKHFNSHYKNDAASIQSAALASGYRNLFNNHTNSFIKFNSQGYVKTDNTAIQNMYDTSLYHIKSFTTSWSIPVGIFDNMWHGRYFAFDELFPFYALITSNRHELAKRVTDFRYNGLQRAITRGSSKNMNCAKYPWETVETLDEAAPQGFWQDHIFHMAHISIAAWLYYFYTGDIKYLSEKSYPVISACAEYYIKHTVYKTSKGKTIVGKCTDLERLGAAVENPYMTTCGVIKTLKICAEASAVLKINEKFAKQCNKIADELFLSLPSDAEKYIPCGKTNQRSIGVFSGAFPYSVIDKDNILQLKAMRDYETNENAFGNCYKTGSGISTWYASWKAAAYAMQKRCSETFKSIEQAAASAGCFGEVFEINEPSTKYRSWFTTGAGCFVSAVNLMLLQSDGKKIYIAPALDTKAVKNVSFKLSAMFGISVEAAIKQGTLTKLKLTSDKHTKVKNVSLVIPQSIFDKSLFEKYTLCGKNAEVDYKL